MAFFRGCLFIIFVTVTLFSQGAMERSRVELPEDEKRAIEDARKNAKPRPFATRKTPWSELEVARIKAYETVKNSIVQISIKSSDPTTGMPNTQSIGSGIVWDEFGHVVTNYHVASAISNRATRAGYAMSRMADLIIRTIDGAEYRVEIEGVAPESDLALLRPEGKIKGVVPIRLGKSSELVVGQSVVAMGNPSGFDHTFTAGLISALDRVIPSPMNTPIRNVIQTDASLNRGNSGGPLLNSSGQMVGLNTAISSPTGWSVGLNYAIPSETVIKEMETLLDTKRSAEPTPPLAPTEDACAGVFNRVKHSVVGIQAKERYHDLFTGNVLTDPVGSGSGIIWDKQGHIVTNFHVVAMMDPMSGALRAADIVTVTTSDDRELAARIVGFNPDIDIALLKLENVADNLESIHIGSSTDLQIGQSVLALGNPFGISQTLTGGIISALNRRIDSPTGVPIKGVLQIDVAINPGSSGGPLLDLNGKLLGINTMIISSSGVNANVGFAVPVELICKGIEDLIGKRDISIFTNPEKSIEEKNRAKVFQQTAESVVFIDAVTEKYDFYDAWTGNIFRLPPASGTGIVWDNKGHIITAYSTVQLEDPITGHITEAEKLTVTLADGKTYAARILGRSLEYGIAVIRAFAPFKDMQPLPLAPESDLKVGQSLLALGNPFGMDYSLSEGVLSAIRGQTSDSRHLIQTDVAINPGNIGGPILDSEGRLVGMSVFFHGPGSHAGINFALSASTLNRIVPLLLAKGQVERPELGFVSVSDLDARSYFQVEKGVLILEVEPNSPAFRAGLKGLQPSNTGRGIEIGDVIVGFSGKAITNSETLWDLIEQVPPKTLLSFDVLRDGKRIKVVVNPK
ncbi:MAG: trypsin-like peptidase domain-containing protein [Holophagaceae bacterium]|nr:trypsin-like peptidase domain-containing protein [Holophagaceae bacterium]